MWLRCHDERGRRGEMEARVQRRAARCARQHGDGVRHADGLGWRLWGSGRWAKDTTAELYRLAKQTARSMYMEAANIDDAVERERAVRWALRSESRGAIEAMLKLAQSEL